MFTSWSLSERTNCTDPSPRARTNGNGSPWPPDRYSAVHQTHLRTPYIPRSLQYSHNRSLPHNHASVPRHPQAHFQEIVRKMVESIPLTLALHTPFIAIMHLRKHVPYQSQRETHDDILLPIAELLLGKGKPECQSHHKDAMTHVSHGLEPADIEGNAQSLDLLGCHGNATHHVMLQETQLDLIRGGR